MTFQLDTTGHVVNVGDGTNAARQPILFWTDLDAFTQGYVEALFARNAGGLFRPLGFAKFSDLAPETLARIIADCEAFRLTPAFVGLAAKIVLMDRELQNAGAEFFHVRARMEDYCHGFKAGDWPQFTTEPLNIAARAFPPLTVQLGDDGKVRFAA